MKLYKILYYKDSSHRVNIHGIFHTAFIKAENPEKAEELFDKNFPDMKEEIFGIAQFIHQDWMKPMEEMEIIEK